MDVFFVTPISLLNYNILIAAPYDRLEFKLMENGDFYHYLSIVSDEKVMHYINGIALDTTQAKVQFDTVIDQNTLYAPLGLFGVYLSSNKQFVGMIKLVPYYENYEIGYSILPQYWNNGYGKEMLGFIIKMASGMNKTCVLHAVTHPQNMASQKILAYHGFLLTEKMEWNYRDLLLFKKKITPNLHAKI